MAELTFPEAAASSPSLRMRCEVCGSPGRPWLERRGRRLVRCSACAFAWVPEGVLRASDGRSIYENEERDLFGSYADYYWDVSATDAARAKLDWVAGFTPPGGHLLDIGANIGIFVREAMARFDAVGIEPSAAMVRWAKQNLGAAVQVGSVFDEMPAFVGRFDAVTMFDVIEHLDDPTTAVQQCSRYLLPGGRLFITTPDISSLVARLLGRAWYYLDVDQHVSLFSAATLTRLLESNGFTVTDRRRFGRRYRFSYIERRLEELGRHSGILRLCHVLALPLRLAPERHVAINLGDVVGIVAQARTS